MADHAIRYSILALGRWLRSAPTRFVYLIWAAAFLMLAFLILWIVLGTFIVPPLVAECAEPKPAETNEVTSGAAEEKPLDEMPEIIPEKLVRPEYPAGERRFGIEGSVIVLVEVLEDGSVGETEPIEEIEDHPALTRATVRRSGNGASSRAASMGSRSHAKWRFLSSSVSIRSRLLLEMADEWDGETSASNSPKSTFGGSNPRRSVRK